MRIFRSHGNFADFSALLSHRSRLHLGRRTGQRSRIFYGRCSSRKAISYRRRAEGAEARIGDATDVDRFSVRAVRKAVRG